MKLARSIAELNGQHTVRIHEGAVDEGCFSTVEG